MVQHKTSNLSHADSNSNTDADADTGLIAIAVSVLSYISYRRAKRKACAIKFILVKRKEDVLEENKKLTEWRLEPRMPV